MIEFCIIDAVLENCFIAVRSLHYSYNNFYLPSYQEIAENLIKIISWHLFYWSLCQSLDQDLHYTSKYKVHTHFVLYTLPKYIEINHLNQFLWCMYTGLLQFDSCKIYWYLLIRLKVRYYLSHFIKSNCMKLY